MSSAYLIEFRDGRAAAKVEFRNSWGGMHRICDPIYKRWLADPNNPFDNWLRDMEKLWPLYKDARLEPGARLVLTFVFDWAVVLKDRFEDFAVNLRAFDRAYPAPGEAANHLPAWADFFQNSTADAIGLHATSCGDCLWFPYDAKLDKTVPYDMSKQSNHFDIYGVQI